MSIENIYNAIKPKPAEEEKEASQEDPGKKRVQESLKHMSDREAQNSHLLRSLDMYKSLDDINTEEMQEKIKALDPNLSDDEYYREVAKTIKPLMDKAAEGSKDFKKITNSYPMKRLLYEQFLNKTGFVEVGELLSYGKANTKESEEQNEKEKKENFIHIHLAPFDRHRHKLEDIQDDFKTLAKKIETDESLKDVKLIRATSPLIAQRPEYLEGFGFTVTGEIAEWEKKKYFKDETRPVWAATFKREDFLEKYLK